MDKQKQSKLTETVAQYFEQAEQKDTEILKQLQLYIYGMDSGDSDLYMLAKLLPEEYVDKLVDYFDGGTLTFPSKENMRVLKMVAIVYFLKKIKGLPWKKIRELLNIEEDSNINTSTFSRRIDKIDDYLKQTFKVLLDRMSQEDVEKILMEDL